LASSNATNIGVFSVNNQYVIAGSNTGQLYGITTENPATIYTRLEREWKVTNTNFTGSFNFSVKLNAVGSASTVNTGDLRLLVDNDGNFTDATIYSSANGLTFTYSNPVITVSGINNTMISNGSTSYITIASASVSTSLPIELTSISAVPCQNEVCIRWQTATEINNDFFTVQRSTDGFKWQ
jgi:hypothetical protein